MASKVIDAVVSSLPGLYSDDKAALLKEKVPISSQSMMILIWLGHRIIDSRSQNRTEYYQRPAPLHITAKKATKMG